MKRIIITTLCLMMAFTLFSQAKNLAIQSISSTPIIDGIGDDDVWTNIDWQNMDQYKGEAANKNNIAKFKLAYTHSPVMLYVYAEVEDATLDTAQSANVWEKDCIEIFISLDITNQASATSGKNGFYHLRKVYGRDMTDADSKKFKVVEETSASGYNQEWALPFDTIAASLINAASWDKIVFRFDIVNVDNDGSGKISKMFWSSNADDQSNCIKNQGYIYLGKWLSGYYLNISQSDFTIGNSSCTNYDTINSNTYWTASSSQSWLKIDTSSGYGDGKLDLSAEANTLAKTRIAYVTLTAGSITRTITVTQSGTSNIALASPPDANVQLKLSPNPCIHKIQVSCQYLISQVEIYNLLGKQVYNKLSSGNELSVPLNGFEEGLYILKVHTDKGIAGGKFAIKK